MLGSHGTEDCRLVLVSISTVGAGVQVEVCSVQQEAGLQFPWPLNSRMDISTDISGGTLCV